MVIYSQIYQRLLLILNVSLLPFYNPKHGVREDLEQGWKFIIIHHSPAAMEIH